MHKVVIKGNYYGRTRTLPDLNDYLHECARHPQMGAKMKRDYQMIVCNAIRTQLPRLTITNPIIIHYNFYEPDKQRDKGYVDTREEALGDQSTSLNPGANAQQFWDALYQFVAQFFALAPIALAIYLLWEPGVSAFRRIGLDFRAFGRNLGGGVLLVAVIGIPGLGLYVAGRALGITVQVDASPLDPSWWTVPLLLLAAVRAGLTEEVIFIGYLFDLWPGFLIR